MWKYAATAIAAALIAPDIQDIRANAEDSLRVYLNERHAERALHDTTAMSTVMPLVAAPAIASDRSADTPQAAALVDRIAKEARRPRVDQATIDIQVRQEPADNAQAAEKTAIAPDVILGSQPQVTFDQPEVTEKPADSSIEKVSATEQVVAPASDGDEAMKASSAEATTAEERGTAGHPDAFEATPRAESDIDDIEGASKSTGAHGIADRIMALAAQQDLPQQSGFMLTATKPAGEPEDVTLARGEVEDLFVPGIGIISAEEAKTTGLDLARPERRRIAPVGFDESRSVAPEDGIVSGERVLQKLPRLRPDIDAVIAEAAAAREMQSQWAELAEDIDVRLVSTNKDAITFEPGSRIAQASVVGETDIEPSAESIQVLEDLVKRSREAGEALE